MRKLWQIIGRLFLAILVLPVIALLLFGGTIMVHQLWKVAVVEPGLSWRLDTVPPYPGSSVKTTTFSYVFGMKEVEYKFIDWDRNNYKVMRILTVPTDPGQNQTRFSFAARQFYLEEMAKQGSWTFYTEGIGYASRLSIVFTHTQDTSLFLTVIAAMPSITLEISHSRQPPIKHPPYFPPVMSVDINKQYTATIKTEEGDLVLKLFVSDAPKTVNNFVILARRGFYDGTIFHRVVPGFMIEGGDPTGTGAGGPGYRFEDEFSSRKHVAGTLSMANSGPNTNGSQFFITYAPQPQLDGLHSVFGELVNGMDVLERIKQGDRIIKVTIEVK